MVTVCEQNFYLSILGLGLVMETFYLRNLGLGLANRIFYLRNKGQVGVTVGVCVENYILGSLGVGVRIVFYYRLFGSARSCVNHRSGFAYKILS